MKKSIFLAVIFIVVLNFPAYPYIKPDKKKKAAEVEKPAYDKFFEGKKMTTSKGFITLHLHQGKVYGELPLAMMGRDLMLSSCIAGISDNREGAVGQSERCNLARFELADEKSLVLKIFTRPSTIGGGQNPKVEASNAGAVHKKMKIECYNADSSALVAQLTPLFLEFSKTTSPFPAMAANSFGGMVERIHKAKPDRSSVAGVKCGETSAVVRCDMGFDVDLMVFGAFPMTKDYPVGVTVNRIVTLLPEPVQPCRADSRVAVRTIRMPDLEAEKSEMKNSHIATRWRLEPGRQIVFYLDPALPAEWKPYIKAGIESWNGPLRKIGYGDAIRVSECPSQAFDLNDAMVSAVRYVPADGANIETSVMIDPRSGEILQASIYLFNGALRGMLAACLANTMGADPTVRTAKPGGELSGALIQSAITRAMGRCLGLAENCAASSLYPVDSLRSASFTRTHGLSPSIMDDVPCNYIAQPEDLAAGVVMIQTDPGAFDEFTIRCLYSENLTESALDRMIKAWPQYRFGQSPSYRADYDPSSQRDDLGDDPVRAAQYAIRNMKRAYPLFVAWYADADDDFTLRNLLVQQIDNTLRSRLSAVMACIGGMAIDNVHQGDRRQTCTVLPKERQREAFRYICEAIRDLDWLNDFEVQKQLEIGNQRGTEIADRFCKDILSRMNYLALSYKRDPASYSPEEFMDDLYAYVWEGTLKRRALSEAEMQLQAALVGTLIATCDLSSPQKQAAAAPAALAGYDTGGPGFMTPGPVQAVAEGMDSYSFNALLRIKNLLTRAVGENTGDIRKHYGYLLFKINQRFL